MILRVESSIYARLISRGATVTTTSAGEHITFRGVTLSALAP